MYDAKQGLQAALYVSIAAFMLFEIVEQLIGNIFIMVITFLITKLLSSPFRLPYLAATVVCGWQTITRQFFLNISHVLKITFLL